jgi:hypothetical protein
VDAERGHASTVEDALDAEIELLIFGEVLGGVELESLIDKTLLVALFGWNVEDLSGWLLVAGFWLLVSG